MNLLYISAFVLLPIGAYASATVSEPLENSNHMGAARGAQAISPKIVKNGASLHADHPTPNGVHKTPEPSPPSGKEQIKNPTIAARVALLNEMISDSEVSESSRKECEAHKTALLDLDKRAVADSKIDVDTEIATTIDPLYNPFSSSYL